MFYDFFVTTLWFTRHFIDFGTVVIVIFAIF